MIKKYKPFACEALQEAQLLLRKPIVLHCL